MFINHTKPQCYIAYDGEFYIDTFLSRINTMLIYNNSSPPWS